MTCSRRLGLAIVGIAATLALATPADAQTRPAWKRDRHAAYSREIAEASARYAVPERLIWAVIRVESGFDRHAVSRKGARGLMQLMPGTAARLGVRDPFDPRQNIQGGTRHLRAMMERFGHDLPLAVAAYNAGEKPVAEYGGVPPYRETRDYVSQVLRLFGVPVPDAVLRRVQPRTDRVRRIVQADGVVLYTNIAFGSR